MALEEDFHFGASPIIFKRAKELRKSSTEAEKVLWKFLRNRNFHNMKFRRQHPISSYIVDFYCHEKNLVIEVDGGIHNLTEEKENDQVRENDLKELGLKILRFKNEDILKNIDQVIKRIEKDC